MTVPVRTNLPSFRLSDFPSFRPSAILPPFPPSVHIPRVPYSIFLSPDILMVRFSAIGDILLTTPLLRAIRS